MTYNYHQSRGRRVIENTFGISTSRWQILLTPILADIKNAEKFVLVCIALHNYLMQTKCAKYSSSGSVNCEDKSRLIKPGEWRSSVVSKILTGTLVQLNHWGLGDAKGSNGICKLGYWQRNMITSNAHRQNIR